MPRRSPQSVERPPVQVLGPRSAVRVGAAVRVVTVDRSSCHSPDGDGATWARVVSRRPLRVDVCGVVVAVRVDGEVDPRRVVRPLDTQGDQRGGEERVHRGDTVRTGCAGGVSAR